ncbi:Nitrite reductase [Dirofilaria immitis]
MENNPIYIVTNQLITMLTRNRMLIIQTFIVPITPPPPSPILSLSPSSVAASNSVSNKEGVAASPHQTSHNFRNADRQQLTL